MTNHNVMDDKWIDVDFEFTGLVESDEDRAFGESRGWPAGVPILERSQWRDAKREQERQLGDILAAYGLPRDRPGWYAAAPWNDQRPQSSCVHNALEVCLRALWSVAFGPEFAMKWSPMSSYAARGRGYRSGDYMAAVMEHSMEYGQLPESSSEESQATELTAIHNRVKALAKHHFHQNSPHARPNDLPSGWQVTAKHGRVTEWIALDSDEEVATAMINRWPILTGRQGHSICYMDLVFDDRGNPFAEYLDSYDKDAGNNGRKWDSPRSWNSSRHNTFAAINFAKPDSPLLPFGVDSIKPDKATLRSLFPRVNDATFESLFAHLA